MIDILAMLPAFVLGWLLVRLLARLGWWIEIPLGIGVGAGASSGVFFLLTWAGAASRWSEIALEALLIAILGFLVFRKEPTTVVSKHSAPSWIWALRIAAVLALGLAAADYSQSLAANPDGGYDAAAIWNLRARYLASGPQSWHYAVSDKTGTNHPGYPLLVSGFVARTWAVLGDFRSSTPAVLSGLFALSAAAFLAGAAATLGGEAIGWLALLVLLATEGFVSQASIQYADVPLSFFILASVALLAIASARDWPRGLVALAGITAGMAAWTKNEGLVFAAFVCAVAIWRSGLRSGRWFAAGAAPLIALTAAFKFLLVDGKEAMFPPTMGQALKMIADGSRWAEIVSSFGQNFWEMGFPWAHPLLLMAVLAWALGLAGEARSRAWVLTAPVALLAADFGIYLITMSGLTWHLSTSNNRVIVQVWPAVLLGFFAMLNRPVAAPPPARRPKKAS